MPADGSGVGVGNASGAAVTGRNDGGYVIGATGRKGAAVKTGNIGAGVTDGMGFQIGVADGTAV
jgi:hypothetical protein